MPETGPEPTGEALPVAATPDTDGAASAPIPTGRGRVESGPRVRRRAASSAPRAGTRPTAGADGLALDLAAVADVAGLTEEVALLRASIRQLAQHADAAERVKVLAEMRHQVEALCTALKTQQALDGHSGDARAAELARALDALGDELGVPR